MNHRLDDWGRWILLSVVIIIVKLIDIQFRNISTLFLSLLFIVASIDQVSSDNCHGGLYCPPPESCCGQICCLIYGSRDEEGLSGIHPAPPLQSHGPYTTYSYYRLSFWNVWYFWLIVIFVVVSCFGGCGYWRRRNCNDVHLESSTSNGFGRSTIDDDDEDVDVTAMRGHNHQRQCTSFVMPNGMVRLQLSSERYGQYARHPLRFHPAGNLFNPPAYNEVTSKPDLYPLVQGGNDLKNTTLAYVYATTPFIHSLLPYNSGAAVYQLSSPAESNSSSLFQSTTTASNYMYPPPYSDGGMYGPAMSVSTPGSMLSACTPTESILQTHFLSSISPPMATTPTSQQYMSEVTTPADSLVTSPINGVGGGGQYSMSTSGSWSYGRRSSALHTSTSEADDDGNVINLANLVADIQSMTNRMTRFPSVIEAIDDVDSSTQMTVTSIDMTPEGDLGISRSMSNSLVSSVSNPHRTTLSLPRRLSSSGVRRFDFDVSNLSTSVEMPPSRITEGTNTSPTE